MESARPLPTPSPQWPYWRLVISAAVASALVFAVDAYVSRHRSSPVASDQPLRPIYGPRSYAEAIAASDTQIAVDRDRVRRQPEDWLRQEGLARTLMARASLSGSYDELAEAAGVMARARAIPPDPSGPVLADAALGMMLHRPAQAEHALATLRRWVVPPDRGERAEATAIAGDLAFYRGDMAGARRAYAEAARFDPGGIAFRTAVLAKAQGDYDGAIAAFRMHLREIRSPSPYQIAGVALQIGAVELARGRAAEARRRFREADRRFPGFWLIEAHLAQAEALAGDTRAAISDMRRIASAHPSAEVIDALAMLLRAEGQAAESRQWAQRAGEIWRRRLQQLPEAAWGHAVEHELVFGSPARALDLAERNVAKRPFGEARLLLAQALVLNGRSAEALEQLRRAEASGWRSAPMHALEAEVLALAGREAEAEQARAKARALNPHVFEPQTALVWLSHG